MCADKPQSSAESIIEANRWRSEFSGHGGSLGAAGFRDVANNPANCAFLNEPGSSIAISPGPAGFEYIALGAAWDNIRINNAGFWSRIFKKTFKIGVDIDIGCIYELQDGTRGAIQAFGEKFGSFETPPYMQLSGDERTGNDEGYDEGILINGAHWSAIKRVFVYLYIYEGAPRWSEIKPQIVLDVPGEEDLIVTLKAHDDAAPLCVVGGIENVRGGIKLTNYTEYFPGHQEMDRAFGFGLEWDEGQK